MNAHHIIFTPKYRRSIFALDPLLAEDFERHLRHICALRNIGILALSIMADHIHLLLDLPRSMSQAEAAGLIKWYSSLRLRKENARLAQIHPAAFWQRNYFARSVGSDREIVSRYIESNIPTGGK